MTDQELKETVWEGFLKLYDWGDREAIEMIKLFIDLWILQSEGKMPPLARERFNRLCSLMRQMRIEISKAALVQGWSFSFL
jgi:hypothetical protein